MWCIFYTRLNTIRVLNRIFLMLLKMSISASSFIGIDNFCSLQVLLKTSYICIYMASQRFLQAFNWVVLACWLVMRPMYDRQEHSSCKGSLRSCWVHCSMVVFVVLPFFLRFLSLAVLKEWGSFGDGVLQRLSVGKLRCPLLVVDS